VTEGEAPEPTEAKSDFLGRFAPQEAMELGGLDGLWHLVDHIVVDDPAAVAVMKWVQGERETALPG